MNDNARAMLLGSFVADALALGPHWIYDTEQIKEYFGVVESITAPQPDSYHAGKKRGDFTHYGDQALNLLESISQNDGFELQGYCKGWQQLFAHYNGYVDKATKATLANLQNGSDCADCGSQSSDLGGAARIAPLIYWYKDDKAQLLKAVTEQTIMTHNHPATLAGVEFIASTAHAILHGTTPAEAFEQALADGVDDMDLDMRLHAAMETGDEESIACIKHFGQPCTISSALPGAVHLVLAHEDNFKEALTANVMAGGDSAARGLVVGMLLGAHLGLGAIPGEWLGSMNAYSHIVSLLK